jgi:hypothetical protein
VPGLTAVAVPYFFHAGQSSTSFAPPLSMFMARAPPRDEPTTTAGWCLSNSPWAIRTARSKSSSGRLGLMTSWPCRARNVGLTPPGTDCQPCRNRTFMVAQSSRRFLAPHP